MKKGLYVGRELKWQVADGFARYTVVKIGKQLTQVELIREDDCYTFDGVFVNSKGNTVVPTPVAKASANKSDFWNELIQK